MVKSNVADQIIKLTLNLDSSLCVSITSMLRCSVLNLTFTEFTTEGAVKLLTTVLPAHRRTHGGSAPTTSHNTLWLFAHWQGLLEATHTLTLNAQVYISSALNGTCVYLHLWLHLHRYFSSCKSLKVSLLLLIFLDVFLFF